MNAASATRRAFFDLQDFHVIARLLPHSAVETSREARRGAIVDVECRGSICNRDDRRPLEEIARCVNPIDARYQGLHVYTEAPICEPERL